MYIQLMCQSLPAQHGVRLSCEDGGIHHKSCIVHNERYSFSQSQSTAMPLFTAEVIHIDHITQSLANCLGVVLCSRRNKSSRYVSPDHGPSKMRIRKRNPGRSWTGGSWGRASVATFTIWGRGRHMNTTEASVQSNMLLQNGEETMTWQIDSDFSFFSPLSFVLTMLPSGRSNIPDAGRQLTLPSLMGGVTWAVAGASPLLPVMFCSYSLSCSSNSTIAGPGPVQTHGADLLRVMVAVQYWQATLSVTAGEMKAQTKSKLWACLHLENLEWQCWMSVNVLFRLHWSILLVIFGDTRISSGLTLSFSKNKRWPKGTWLQMRHQNRQQ